MISSRPPNSTGSHLITSSTQPQQGEICNVYRSSSCQPSPIGYFLGTESLVGEKYYMYTDHHLINQPQYFLGTESLEGGKYIMHTDHQPNPTVKMETLCSRFYADISGTSGDIDMGSSGECRISKAFYCYLNFIFLQLACEVACRYDEQLLKYQHKTYCTEFPI